MTVTRPSASLYRARLLMAPSARMTLGSIALGLVLAGCIGGSPMSELTTGPTDTPSAATSTAPATASPTLVTSTAPATASPTLAPSTASTSAPTATPTPVATPALCGPAQVAITIVKDQGIYWQGGTGQRMATFQLKNTSSKACVVKKMSRPELINGNGAILIKGAAPGASASLTVGPGGTLKTTVQTGNLCHAPAIVSPTRVAFVLVPGGTAILATPPVNGGVPPCLGDPAVASGSIAMPGWAP